jgi:membrane-bound metal-dependent hydrolase YbcI (DUF457 family)
MDPLTHCLVGGLAAKTVHTSKRRFWIMVLLGSAPDLDVLFNFFGSWAFWLQHRGVTHSLLGLVIQPLLFAWLFRKFDPGSLSKRTFHYSLPIILHVICDGLTSYGIPLLSPFSFQEFSADLMVGLSFIPILFMGFGLYLLYRKESGGWKEVRPLWFGWALYFCMAISAKAYAAKLVQVPTSLVIPSMANPFLWSGIQQDEADKKYHAYQINLMAGSQVVTHSIPLPATNDEWVLASQKSPLVQVFQKENRWPVVRVISGGENQAVQWGRLLFSTRGVVRGKIEVLIDPKGKILEEKKIFNFWNP